MDTTEQRAGLRLPWSDRRASPVEDGTANGVAADAEGNAGMQQADAPESPADETSPPEGSAREGSAPEAPALAEAPGSTRTPASRRPSRFLAELTRAMHAAAEEGRVATLEQLHAEGKTAVEEIQSRSTDDATAIRRHADDDVAHIREWSKAEIARIREEAEQRIAARKLELDQELESHAAVVEAEVENVHGQVTAFERDMEDFFERLIAEEDPGRFADLAASLPEPAPFTPLSDERRAEIAARLTAAPEEVEQQIEAEVPAEAVMEEAAPDDGAVVDAETVAAGGTGEAEDTGGAEAPAVNEVGPNAGPTADDTLLEPPTEEAALPEGIDPRLAALPDFAGAERDALAGVSAGEGEAQGAVDGSLSARLAGLAGPTPHAAPQAPAEDAQVTTSQVIVTGLTSVSSIAAFKRQLGRLDSVRSVAVSSGPSGEFVFAVTHADGARLADGVASLGGFSPQISKVEPGLVELTARDPEA